MKLELVLLSTGDSGLIVNGQIALSADPQFDNTSTMEVIARNLSSILGVELAIISAEPPPMDDWNWDDVLETLPSANSRTAAEVTILEAETPVQYTKADFDKAASQILGADAYAHLVAGGFNRADICREVSQAIFMQEALNASADAIQVICATAKRLWRVDGMLGLMDS